MGLVQETRIYDLPTISEKKANVSGAPTEREPEKKELLGAQKKELIDVSLMIIARKEVCRLGARFYSRGIDEDGNVSNFVETEQILRLRHAGKLDQTT